MKKAMAELLDPTEKEKARTHPLSLLFEVSDDAPAFVREVAMAAVCAIAEVGLLPENRLLIAEANGIPSLNALLTLGVVGTPETAARALANLARDGLLTPDDGCAATHGTPLEASRAVAEPASGCMVTSQERFATLTHTRATPPSQRRAVGGRR